jgi:hypothetical protein
MPSIRRPLPRWAWAMEANDWREKALDDLIRDSEALKRRSQVLVLRAEKLRERCAELREYSLQPARRPNLRRLK